MIYYDTKTKGGFKVTELFEENHQTLTGWVTIECKNGDKVQRCCRWNTIGQCLNLNGGKDKVFDIVLNNLS